MATDQLSIAFGRVLLRRRQAANLSQETLADLAGLHRVSVYMLEKGKRAPSLEVVHKLAQALGTTMAVLVSETEKAMR